VAQKNRALGHVTHDWVLSIDADERVSPELARSIAAALATDPPVSGFRVSRASWWLDRRIRHGTWYPDRRVRLFHRDRARWGGSDPHDVVEVEGPVIDLEGDLLHHPYRSVSDHVAKVDAYARIAARSHRARGRRARIVDVLFRPPLHFLKAYLWKRGFLDGVPGLVVATLGATYVLLKWARLYLELGDEA
jgi:hypothetical protein